MRVLDKAEVNEVSGGTFGLLGGLFGLLSCFKPKVSYCAPAPKCPPAPKKRGC